MRWIKVEDRNKVRDYLPMDGSTFIALWKGQFCLCCYDEDIDHFWIQMQPGIYEGDLKVDHEREGKFTHFCLLKYPEDY